MQCLPSGRGDGATVHAAHDGVLGAHSGEPARLEGRIEEGSGGGLNSKDSSSRLNAAPCIFVVASDGMCNGAYPHGDEGVGRRGASCQVKNLGISLAEHRAVSLNHPLRKESAYHVVL